MGTCCSTPHDDGDGGTVKVSDYFEIHEELGSGAFSNVYRATDKERAKDVALKMIPSIVFDKNREQTEREVKILQTIDRHENIVQLLKVIRGKKYFTIAMELLTGGELF